MGSGDFREVRADDVRQAGDHLDEPSNTVASAYRRLRTTLDVLGEPWGDDENGLRFAASYEPARDNLFQTLDDVQTGFGEVRHGLHVDAAGREQVEEDNSR